MSLSRRPRALLAALALLSAVTACTQPAAGDPAERRPHGQATLPSEAPPPPPPRDGLALAVEKGRQSPGTVVAGGGDAVYNYAPAVMLDGGKVRTWWCSQMGTAQPNGDDILYSEGPSANGPFTTARPVFSGSRTSFDAIHTCDPSLVKIAGTYYLYYTGASRDNHANGSSVGVATSKDGITWTRANNGRPILAPANDVIRPNAYGAGQQSAVYLDGWVYLMFTDTTGRAAAHNGAGQFVLRSRDPLFTTAVESLGPDGFVPVASTATPRTRSVVEAFSADWMWIDAASAFAIAHSTDGGTTVTFWNKDFTRHPFDQVLIPGAWKEGPGLVRTAAGHAPAHPTDPCGRVPLDVLRATVNGGSGAPTNIRRFGLDAVGLRGCATVEEARVLERFAMPSPVRTIDMVANGKLVRFERRSVAEKVARAVLDTRPPIADLLEVAHNVPARAPAVRAEDGGVGLLLDDTLLVVDSPEVATLNSSEVTLVTAEQWMRYPRI